MKRKLCFATNNHHKIAEASGLLAPWFQVLSLSDVGCIEELPETTGTIPGNSRQKAEYVSGKFKIDCFADDSGLEVFALGGDPGVDSAVYAGPQRSHEDNIQLLLKNMLAAGDRRARFITVITLIVSERVFQFEGVLAGQIIHEKRGAHGFGYDPVFIPDGYDITLAEMSMEEKNRISHRAQAVGKMITFFKGENSTI